MKRVPHPSPSGFWRERVDALEFRSGPVTLLILLPRPAGARVIPPNFFLPADNLLHRLSVSRTRHASLFQFAALAAHEGFFQLVRGSGHHARRTLAVAIAAMLRWHS